MRKLTSRAIVACAALAVACTAPGTGARAADAPAPLRRLIYEIDYGITMNGERRTSGLTGGQNALGNANAKQRYGGGEDNRGTLTVDVVAVSPEGALVTDVSLRGTKRSQPTVRIAILPDGRLGVDPKLEIRDEVRRFLPLFASKVIAGRDLHEGASWSQAFAEPLKGATTYRVVSTDGERATLAIETDLRIPAAGSYEEHGQAKAEYSVRLIDPITYDLFASIRQAPDTERTETSNLHLTAKLVSDSFANRPKS